MPNYQKSFTVDRPAGEVYAALTDHIAKWWSNDLSGAASQVGDSYHIAFGATRKTMKIVEAIPDRRIVWECVKAYIDMDSLPDKSEWVGTTMIWTLEAAGGSTSLHFLHEGLHPGLACYEVCESGWNTFLASLHAYLATGKGRPYLKAVNSEATPR